MKTESWLRTVACLELLTGIFMLMWKLVTFLILDCYSGWTARLVTPIFMVIAGGVALPCCKSSIKIIQHRPRFGAYLTFLILTLIGDLTDLGLSVRRLKYFHTVYNKKVSISFPPFSLNLEWGSYEWEQIFRELNYDSHYETMSIILITFNCAAIMISLISISIICRLRWSYKKSGKHGQDDRVCSKRSGSKIPRSSVRSSQRRSQKDETNDKPSPIQPLEGPIIIQTSEGAALLQPIQTGGMHYQKSGIQIPASFRLVPIHIQNEVEHHPLPSAPPSGESQFPPPYTEVSKSN